MADHAERAHVPKQSATDARAARGPQARPAGRCLGAAAQLAAMHRILRHGPILQLEAGAVAAVNRTGLPDKLKSGVEALSGISLDGVKVHYNSAKPAQLDALAYAQGSDIHLAPGQERHLPHEAWHVVQQAQGRVKPTLQMKDGVRVDEDERLEREADFLGARAAQAPVRQVDRPIAGAVSKDSSAPVQRKRFEFDADTLDSSDIPAFEGWCETMARVNPDRLRGLLRSLQGDSRGIDAEELITLITIAKHAAGEPLPNADLTIGQEYDNVLQGLDRLVAHVPRHDAVRKTIRAAALIDANAALIAAFGPYAKTKVKQLAGDAPSTGFAGESEFAIRMRARVLLEAWGAAADDPSKVRLFNEGFGNDPCLAARLNGITEFRATQVGIPQSALSDAKYDVGVSMEILGLIDGNESTFKRDDGYDWAGFLNFLQTDHQDIFDHPDFHPSYAAAKEGYI